MPEFPILLSMFFDEDKISWFTTKQTTCKIFKYKNSYAILFDDFLTISKCFSKSFKAYLESNFKMYIFLLTNTNQNPVVLSLCLVFLNAHVNAHNSSLNFRQYSLSQKMQECVFVEKLRHKWNLAAIAELSEYCDALSCNGYRSRNTWEFPSYGFM